MWEKVSQSPSESNPRPNPAPRTLVFGCGYLGRKVAEKAFFAGHNVWATTRRADRAKSLQTSGIQPVIADWTDSRTLGALPRVDQILVSVSYDRHSGQSRWASQVVGLRNLLQAVPPETSLCYISTTGVYHQTDGGWVDEVSPTRPRREGGKVHLQAEDLLRRSRPHSQWTILRLAGIYGPHRVPRAADVAAGRPIASPEAGYINLIHVEDAAEAVLAVWRISRPERLYVVGDDAPVIRRDFYREIANRIGASAPQFIERVRNEPETEKSVRPIVSDATGAMGSIRMRSETHKRVWNRRMKRDLVPRLKYPTFREGLADVLGV